MELQRRTQTIIDQGISKLGSDDEISVYPNWVMRDGFKVEVEKLTNPESQALSHFWIEFSEAYPQLVGVGATRRLKSLDLNSLLMTLKAESVQYGSFDSLELMPVSIGGNGESEPIYDFRLVEDADAWAISGHHVSSGVEPLFQESLKQVIPLLEKMVKKSNLPVISPMLKFPLRQEKSQSKAPDMN